MKAKHMNEIILNTNTLPEPLLRMFKSERVKVRQADGVVSLWPMPGPPMPGPPEGLDQLFGMFSDGTMSVDKFLAEKHAEKDLEL